MYRVFLLAFLGIFPLHASAQSLDRLLERASQFWVHRAAGSKLGGLDFVETDKREQYLGINDPPILRAAVTALGLTETSGEIQVRTDMRVVLPRVGEVDWVIQDLWVWNGDDWYFRPRESGDPFAPSTPEAPQPVTSIEFELLTPEIHMGRYVQGETIEGHFEFRARREEVARIVVQYVPGMIVRNPVWSESEPTGRMHFTIDTRLIPEDIRWELDFTAIAFDRTQNATAKGRIAADIEGRLRFRQIPEIIDTSAAGTVDIEIHNLMQQPLEIQGLSVPDSAYSLESEELAPLAPGETATVRIRYTPRAPLESRLDIHFVDSDILGSPYVSLPINVRRPQPTAPQPPNRQQIEELIRTLNP